VFSDIRSTRPTGMADGNLFSCRTGDNVRFGEIHASDICWRSRSRGQASRRLIGKARDLLAESDSSSVGDFFVFLVFCSDASASAALTISPTSPPARRPRGTLPRHG